MGNINSIPAVSQVKSLTQLGFRDATAAAETQKEFVYDNTFPILSQITSAGYAITGQPDKALELQKKFVGEMAPVINSIPVAGHIKGGVHYAMGDNEGGYQAMKAATRSTVVVLVGVGGFFGGGPLGAFAGGVAGGIGIDGVITSSESLLNKDKAKPYGYFALLKEVTDAKEKGTNISVGRAFDMFMLPVFDAFTGYTSARIIGKCLAVGPVEGPVGGGGGPVGGAVGPLLDASARASVWINYLGLDKKALDNRANQLNPNHQRTGPGRSRGYHCEGTKPDLDNYSRHLNPEHPLYHRSRRG